MKYYNLLFNGVEVNKKPLHLTVEQFEQFKNKMLDTAFDVVLDPNNEQIEWFNKLPAEIASKICFKSGLYPLTISSTDIAYLHKTFSKKYI